MRGDDHARFDRVAVGRARGGAVFILGAFAAAQDTISLAEFSKIAMAVAEAQHASPITLLGMDGGPSAHIYFPRTDLLFGDRGPTYLPSAICVSAR